MVFVPGKSGLPLCFFLFLHVMRCSLKQYKKKDESVLPTLRFQEVDWKPVPLFRVCVLQYIRSAWQEFTHLLAVHHALACCSLSSRGNITVPKLSESNMGFGVLGVFLGLLLEVSTHGPPAVPRTSWRHQGKELQNKWLIILLFI